MGNPPPRTPLEIAFGVEDVRVAPTSRASRGMQSSADYRHSRPATDSHLTAERWPLLPS